MRVLLKQGDRLENVSDITLEDGYRPLVGGETISTSADAAIQIESALWYKTLLVDTVYIDCDERSVHWLKVNNTVLKTIDDECPRFVPLGTERLFGDSDVYDFDPTVDELCDRAVQFMTTYGMKKITWKTFLSEVARLLHSYILPAMCFRKDDQYALYDTISSIEGKSEIVDTDILNKTKAIELTEASLKVQRMRILQNEKFESEYYVRSCKRDFLCLLYKDVERDISFLSSELEEIQLHVNKYRDCSYSDGMKLKLEHLRKQRNDIHENLAFMQVARETLKNVLFRRPLTKKKKLKKVKVKQNVFHEIYVEMNERLRKQKENMQRACLKKVKISAVREAIFTALSDIKSSKDEYGLLSYTDGSEFFLDITGKNAKPDTWKTLEEKVYAVLQNERSRPSQKHYQGSKMILDKISSAYGDCKMFGSSTESSGSSVNLDDIPVCLEGVDVRAINIMGNAARRRRTHVPPTVPEPPVADDLDPMTVDALKNCIEGVKMDIKSQMEDVSSMLITGIPECAEQHRNKVWISYENVFYLDLLSQICDLYELAYYPVCVRLFRTMSDVPLEELLPDDKIMAFIIRKLESVLFRRPLNFQRLALDRCSLISEEFEILRPPSNHSFVSVQIKNCTLEELYSMADRECQQMKGSIPNLFDENNCGPVVVEETSSLDDESERMQSDVTSSEADEEEDSFDEEEGDVYAVLHDLFSQIYPMLEIFFKVKTLLDKLRQLTRVFRVLGNLLYELSQDSSTACCDEMLSMIIILLRSLDEKTFVRFYSHIMLLIDLKAPFLIGSVHDCSLTNFYSAFYYLFSSQVRKSSVEHDSRQADEISWGSR